MEYELALELKKAGFPQIHNEDDCKRNDCYEPKLCQSVPTLEELIDACGEECWEINRTIGGSWQAWEANRSGKMGTGSTPEEAVARLWLALNNNKEV